MQYIFFLFAFKISSKFFTFHALELTALPRQHVAKIIRMPLQTWNKFLSKVQSFKKTSKRKRKDQQVLYNRSFRNNFITYFVTLKNFSHFKNYTLKTEIFQHSSINEGQRLYPAKYTHKKNLKTALNFKLSFTSAEFFYIFLLRKGKLEDYKNTESEEQLSVV